MRGRQRGPSSEPLAIQKTQGTCEQPNLGGEPTSSVLGVQAACDSQLLLAECPSVPGEEYPRREVKLLALPKEETMPNPCEGVPGNRWCTDGCPIGSG
jgi:hypothetical protein